MSQFPGDLNKDLEIMTGHKQEDSYSTVAEVERRHPWFSQALRVAQHEDQKRRWHPVFRFLHWLFVSWHCPCCALAKEDRRAR